mmetsp:Transcript_81998/g.145248  ORF Transcript_81998/g.145248 Transcript_81998/m.145248 type:complete len:229 (+) Transcript_81998:79-765(+)
MHKLILLLACLGYGSHGRRVSSLTQQVKSSEHTDEEEQQTLDGASATSSVFAALDLSNGLTEADGPQDSSKALGRLLLALTPAAEAHVHRGNPTLDASQLWQCLLETEESKLDEFTQYTTKIAVKAAFSSVMGFSCGYCIKKAGRAAAFAAGLVFMFLTALELKGYIKVNWDKIAQDTVGKWDLNDDGKVDAKDAKVALKMFVHYMTQGGAVSHATFTAWLLYGLKQG